MKWHGHATNGQRSPTYKVWEGLFKRCYQKGFRYYPLYGGRGITVCDRWKEPQGQGFLNFLADMGERPNGASIDRLDNNRGYEPGNCRWATPKEQSRNRDYCTKVTYNGETRSVSEWAEALNVSYRTLYLRIYQGWSLERAFKQKVKKYPRRITQGS
jgi:hypothetical protein